MPPRNGRVMFLRELVGRADANSLLSRIFSLLCLEKFPVPLRGEFGRNRLNFPDDRKRRSLPAARIFKIPCYFPCYQGIWMLRPVRSGLHPPPRSPMRTDVSRSLTNSPQFAGISAGSNAGRAVSGAGCGRDSDDFGCRSLGSENAFLAPAGVAHQDARIKSTNRASRIGGTTRQEHRAGE